MNTKLKPVLRGYYLFCIIAIIFMFILANENFANHKSIVIFTFMVNGIYILVNLLRPNKLGYSLKDVLFVFMFVFMFLSPIVQYINNSFPWSSNYNFPVDLVIKANIFIFIFMLCFNLTEILIKDKRILKYDKIMDFHNYKIIFNFGFILSLIVTVFIIYNVGFINLFSRSTNSLGLNGSMSLLIDKSLKGFPLVMVILHIYYKQLYKQFYNINHFIILLIFVVLLHFPTGIPRFQVAVVYISLLVAILGSMSNKFLFRKMLLLGVLFVFPLLNVFRRNSINNLDSTDINNLFYNFSSGHYDAFSMFVRGISYVETEAPLWGEQLVGSLLFFVPRSIWPTKPTGTGAFIADYLNWDFANVSFPYLGESYVNFGFFGLFFFSIILALIIKKMDNGYELLIVTPYITILRIYYPMFLGFLFLILRGDLLSSFAFAIGYFFPVLFLYFIDRLSIYLNLSKKY